MNTVNSTFQFVKSTEVKSTFSSSVKTFRFVWRMWIEIADESKFEIKYSCEFALIIQANSILTRNFSHLLTVFDSFLKIDHFKSTLVKRIGMTCSVNSAEKYGFILGCLGELRTPRRSHFILQSKVRLGWNHVKWIGKNADWRWGK